MSSSIRSLLAAPAGRMELASIDPDSTPGANHATIKKQGASDRLKLEQLQERLRAESLRSLLVILQGMDTSGKDGTIKHVIGSMDPQGCRIASFKAPSSEELAHDFLWRIKKQLPAPGEVAVFNRSHYEDVVTVRVHDLVPEDVWRPRFARINAFERDLSTSGTIIVKIFLHISFEEQRERLLERLNDPSKRWKFDPNDVNEREFWDAYQAAFDEAITQCPSWFIVPANHKRYRDWAIGRLLIEILEEASRKYPEPNLDIPSLKKRLS
ncbi:MAG: PPK2 family polyphosphate kinase [Actinomycetota bacterium]